MSSLCCVFTYNAASPFKVLPEITKHDESIFHYAESALRMVDSSSKESGRMGLAS